MSVAPRPAATTILLRPGAGGFEAFLLRRSSRSAFMPDVYVFPGGALDAADYGERMLARVYGPGPDSAAELFRDEARGAHAAAAPLSPEQRLGIVVAAARELYEEAGVLLVSDARGRAIDVERDPARAGPAGAARARVAAGELPFAALLEEIDAYVDPQAFIYFSHWITPEAEPRRFDAYFFVAITHEHQSAAADACETHDGVWIAPRAALERSAAGTFALMFPTIKHLERAAEFAGIDDFVRYARGKAIVPVMPLAPSGTKVAPGVRLAIDETLAAGW